MLNRYIRHFGSAWAGVQQGPPDPILGVTENFKKDTNPKKVSLGVGAYRDDNNKPWTLTSVQMAKEKYMKAGKDHEYLPIEGLSSFREVAAKLLYGDDATCFDENRVVTCQSLSGTGSLRLGFEFLNRWWGGNKEIYIPAPTWGNHKNIATDAGMVWKEYSYYDKSIKKVNIGNTINDITNMPDESIVVLHSVAHNPTGADPTLDEWAQISDIAKQKGHLCFFDNAYQGFASGDADIDAQAFRHCLANGNRIMSAQSFAKNFGLYGERIGNFTVLCDNEEEAGRVMSQVKIIARPIYSNPPLFGANIVSTILNEPELKDQWKKDIKIMADRIILMRSKLVNGLTQLGSEHDWSHITAQIGMFAFTGLSPEMVERITNEYHIYLTKDGRISVAGLNSTNVDYVAEALHAVTKDTPVGGF